MKVVFGFFVAIWIVGICSYASAEDILTRFGTLTISDENTLLFKGHPLTPSIEGNNSLSLVEKFQLNTADVVLIQDNGGTACPAQYYFITVSQASAKPTQAFGTCSDLIKTVKRGNSIVVSMPGFTGPFESKTAKTKATKETHVYSFADGLLKENGNLVK